jgi:hypothetical protein
MLKPLSNSVLRYTRLPHLSLRRIKEKNVLGGESHLTEAWGKVAHCVGQRVWGHLFTVEKNFQCTEWEGLEGKSAKEDKPLEEKGGSLHQLTS